MKKRTHNPVPDDLQTVNDSKPLASPAVMPKDLDTDVTEKPKRKKKKQKKESSEEDSPIKESDDEKDFQDDRDETIEKLKNVNELLREKVKDLEGIVNQTISKPFS